MLQGVHTAAFGPWSKDYEALYWATARRCTPFVQSASNPELRAKLLRQMPGPAWMNELDLLENLRFARLCAWLRHQGEPPHAIGHSLFIWKLDQAALIAALIGPPVELTDRPAQLRRFREFVAFDQ
jgi:hypothetical protein